MLGSPARAPPSSPHMKRIPALVVAGTASGVGKTTIVAGLLAALRRRGLKVQPFKCGPDYIDPGYHTRAAGRPCRNLDSWMLDDAQVVASFARATQDADLAIIEGVMGLYDGSEFENERASAAQIAKLLGAPVLLVLDISGAARSAAATALGFLHFDPALTVGAFALNFAGSEGHARGCTRAIETTTHRPVLGWLTRHENLRLPERHLGLIAAGEQTSTANAALLDQLANVIECQFNLDALLQLAATAETSREIAPTPDTPTSSTAANKNYATPPTSTRRTPPPLLAVARDDAFCFYYPDNLDLLEAAGARLAFFSPARGERLPSDAAGMYLGGGYPELHAAALSANTAFHDDLRALHSRGAPIFAECGGFMMLTEALIDLDGRRWPMAGLVPGVTRMTPQIASLGYRQATALHDNLLVPTGTTLRGHEFHYSVWEKPAALPDRSAWSAHGTQANALAQPLGYVNGNLLASYLHIHLGQAPELARRLVGKLMA